MTVMLERGELYAEALGNILLDTAEAFLGLFLICKLTLLGVSAYRVQ